MATTETTETNKKLTPSSDFSDRCSPSTQIIKQTPVSLTDIYENRLLYITWVSRGRKKKNIETGSKDVSSFTD